MQVIKITDQIYQFNYKNLRTMSKAFLRLQEHYESPYFKDKVFTVSEFREWYIKEYGVFDYYSSYDGFNIPSTVVTKFLDPNSSFKHPSYEEKALLRELKAIYQVHKNNPFYIIGTHTGEPSAIRHELAHALWHINKEYRNRAISIMDFSNVNYDPMIKGFLQKHYHKSVWHDEIHAYLLANWDYLEDEQDINIDEYKNIINKLNINFSYFKEKLCKKQNTLPSILKQAV